MVMLALTPLLALLTLDPGPTCSVKSLRAQLPDVDFTVISGPRTLVAAQGKLWAATCGAEGPAKLEVVFDDPPIDFRRYVPLPDGRDVFGSTGGLVTFDPVTLQKQNLTAAESYDDKACWTAEKGQLVQAWDRDPRPAGADGAVVFSRGGPCGYEGAATSTTMVVDLATKVTRPTTNVPAFTLAAGAAWLGDGGASCTELQTPATVFVRGLDGRFVALKVGDDLKMGVVALAATHELVWALTGICDTGGARRGGNLFVARAGDVLVANTLGFTAPWKRVDVMSLPDDRGVDDGQGLVAIASKKNEIYVARENGGGLAWRVSKDGGKTWKATRYKAAATKIPKDLAATLGVVTVHGTLATKAETWAWTDDGAFVKTNAKDATWRKVFP